MKEWDGRGLWRRFSWAVDICILKLIHLVVWASLVPQAVKHLPAMQETWVWSLGREDPLEKEMATHSSILAWRIPWTEEPGGLHSMGSQRTGHDWAPNRFTWQKTTQHYKTIILQLKIKKKKTLGEWTIFIWTLSSEHLPWTRKNFFSALAILCWRFYIRGLI